MTISQIKQAYRQQYMRHQELIELYAQGGCGTEELRHSRNTLKELIARYTVADESIKYFGRA